MAILKSTQVNGNLSVSQDLTVGGSLNVQGDLTYIGVNNLRVKDKQIELNTNNEGSAAASGQEASGSGIVIRGAKNTTKEGSEEASILYNYANDSLVINKTIEGTVSNATTADKVANTLTVSVKKKVGSEEKTESVVFDGSATRTVDVDLSGLQNQIDGLSNEIDSLSGGVGSIATQITNAINELDAPDTAKDGQYVSAVSETDGKITVTRAALPDYKDVYDAKGSAAAVLGKEGDDSTVTTVYGVKAYAKKRADELAAGKADTEHIHKITDVTGLEAALAGKAAESHTHVVADITDLSGELAKKQDALANAAVLSAITSSTQVTNWENAAAKVHEHTNKEVLDGISAEKVAAWDAAEQNAKNYTDTEIENLGLGNAAQKNVLNGTIAKSPSSTDLVTAAQVKTYADGLNTAMDGRVAKLEAIDHKKLADDASAAAVAAVVDGAPQSFDTLKEIAAWIANNDHAQDVEQLVTDVADLKKIDHNAYKAADEATLASAKTYADNLAAGKADTEHTHAIADVINLQTTLDGKAAANHNHDKDYSKLGHKHEITEVNGLDTALAGKQDTLANAAVLADITSSAQVTNWDNAAAKVHEHDNKTVLDGITEAKVTAWDGAVSARVISVGGKSGILTLKGGSETLGDVNLSISDDGKISAAIVPNSFDKSGAAAQALKDANTYTDGAKSAVIGNDSDDKNADTIKGAKAYADAVKSEVIGVDGDAASKDTIYGAKKYADEKVKTLSDNVTAKNTDQDTKIANIENSITSIQSNYVKKVGDTMTGELIMSATNIRMPDNGDNGIIFGNMKIVWKNSADGGAIEFVPITTTPTA